MGIFFILIAGLSVSVITAYGNVKVGDYHQKSSCNRFGKIWDFLHCFLNFYRENAMYMQM